MSPVSTPSKISIQNPILIVELGNQRKNNLDSKNWKEKSKARKEVLHGLF